MNKHPVARRTELLDAELDLGTLKLSLEEFATTGIRACIVSTSGGGKTSLALLIAEQLSSMGWVSVLVDPEGEIGALYSDPVADEDELATLLKSRKQSIVVVSATTPDEFLPYAKVIQEAANKYRKPIFLFIDEGQMFSAARLRKKNSIGEASDIIDDLAQRARKRSLDLCITTQRYVGTLSRAVFATKTMTFIGRQEDPTAWSALSPQFNGTGVTFRDLSMLAPGEFYCFTRRGCEKIRVPMAAGLTKVALSARTPKAALPTTFAQWSQAMARIPVERLEALDDHVVELLTIAAGLNTQQALAGARALRDELEARS